MEEIVTVTDDEVTVVKMMTMIVMASQMIRIQMTTTMVLQIPKNQTKTMMASLTQKIQTTTMMI